MAYRFNKRSFAAVALCAVVLLFTDNVEEATHRLLTGTPLTRTVKANLKDLEDLAEGIKKPKEINVLALGGSTTWAQGLQSRANGYPFLLGRLLGNATVDNLAIRAEGSATPSRCIETLTSGKTEGFFTTELDVQPRSYHVILLEFTLNGANELTQLVARLRQRFPDAIFIYMHLHPQGYDYSHQEEHERMLHTVVHPSFHGSGHVYSLPFSRDMEQLYSKDGIHMNLLGHIVITKEILKILEKESLPESPRLGEWETRDYCHSWFTSGIIPESVVLEGGVMAEFNKGGGKFAYEISEKASMTIHNPYDDAVPLGLTFMVRGTEGKYPKTVVDIEGQEHFILIPEQARLAHLQKTVNVGLVQPGENIIHFETLVQTQWPLRVTGFSLIHNNTSSSAEDVEIVGDFEKHQVLENAEQEMARLIKEVPRFIHEALDALVIQSSEGNNARTLRSRENIQGEGESSSVDFDYSDFSVMDSGVRYKIISKGKGRKPPFGFFVDVAYIGWVRGFGKQKFDSASKMTFHLGDGDFFPAWDETLLQMHKEERRIIIVPPERGFGSDGVGHIVPRDATLYIAIELLSIRAEPSYDRRLSSNHISK